MGQSFRIFRVYGIDIKVHFSLLFILAFLIYAFYVMPPPYGYSDFPQQIRSVMAIITTIAFFGCILFHELCHSYFALKFGSKVRGIILFIFGGVSLIDEIPKEPKKEFVMAIAGPAGSFVLALVSYIFMFTPNSVVDRFFFIMWYFNLVLGVFNLIPAFPMDGGRVLRSVLAGRMGFIRATKVAAEVGRFMAIAMAILGLLMPNIWLILIALFVYLGAGEEERHVTLEGILNRFKVADIMTPNPICVKQDMPKQQVLNLMMKFKHLGYPVTDDFGRIVGVVTLKDLLEKPGNTVGEVMSRKIVVVRPDATADKVLKLMMENNIGRLPVVDEDGKVVGIVTRSDIMRVTEIVEVLKQYSKFYGTSDYTPEFIQRAQSE
jgi:Zn-dependent protease/predicted transcriptional regulator